MSNTRLFHWQPQFVRLVGLGILIGSTGVIGQIGMPAAISQPAPIQLGSATSSSDAISLARHLRATGAKMYGAYWCPHCAAQRRLFGRIAFNLYIDYIECASNGYRAQPKACEAAEIKAYPTWVIQGKYHEGVHSLKELAALSGYSGSQKF
jgi:glutaredoxin